MLSWRIINELASKNDVPIIYECENTGGSAEKGAPLTPLTCLKILLKISCSQAKLHNTSFSRVFDVTRIAQFSPHSASITKDQGKGQHVCGIIPWHRHSL